MGPGDFLSVPHGTPHTFDNLRNGDEPVRATNLMTPAGLFELGDELAHLETVLAGTDAARDVAECHGTVVLGPPLRVRVGLE